MNKESNTVLVTGGSGYVASWIVKLLLEEGYHVRTTVRNKKSTEKYAHLQQIADTAPGRLEISEADLMHQQSFVDAMVDCEWVIHTASPFKVGKIKNPEMELINPALEGTQNVLQAASQSSSVKRVVLTSSVAAVFGDGSEILDAGIFTEDHWNNSSNLSHQPYNYSKTVAERKAWEMSRRQKQWDLVVINPGFIMGPSLTTRKDSTSISFMLDLINGKFKAGVPPLYFGMVDVRDVAKAHILAAQKKEASGRHILVENTYSILDLGKILQRSHPDLPLPSKELPKALMYLVGPFLGFKWKYVSKNIGYKLKFDNSYSINDLGIRYTPMETTLSDHADQLLNKN